MNGMPMPRQAKANDAFMLILMPQASNATARTVKTALTARQAIPARLKAVSVLVLFVFIVEVLSVGCSSFDNKDIKGLIPICIYKSASSQIRHDCVRNMNCPFPSSFSSIFLTMVLSKGKPDEKGFRQ